MLRRTLVSLPFPCSRVPIGISLRMRLFFPRRAPPIGPAQPLLDRSSADAQASGNFRYLMPVQVAKHDYLTTNRRKLEGSQKRKLIVRILTKARWDPLGVCPRWHRAHDLFG